jgi:hypothetical protein
MRFAPAISRYSAHFGAANINFCRVGGAAATPSAAIDSTAELASPSVPAKYQRPQPRVLSAQPGDLSQ